MAKKLHLLCNAHLDPVWQWEWEEGAAETLSTFRIAADFCDEYDNFVFCHNEALLYKWIEEYDMPLFERIRELVKKGKWHIMGGWHLQPDCNMPSGEGFVRQIYAGRAYFLEKFGVVPKVAINLDPFGHSRGLVQILNKTGYDGYLFMRPAIDTRYLELPSNEFKWVGYDGSEVVAVRIHGNYNSPKGKAADKVREFIDMCDEDDFFLCLWGIGNHGGGPSKEDLDNIEKLSAEVAKDGVELVHSTPEEYFNEVMQKHTLPEFTESLNPWGVGCYTSQVRIKQKYRLAENTYFMAEIMASHASSQKLIKYPEEELAQALYDIITVQFHDMLPGSSIQPAEEMSIRMLDHAIEILSRVRARAFFALAAGQKKADSDKIPMFAYNPYPYPISGDFVCEFMLWDQIWSNEFLMPRVYSESGEIVPSQCEKEHSNIPLEWRKRVVFNATLKPMSLNRFDCAFDVLDRKPTPFLESGETHYVFDRGDKHIEINKNTGLVDVFAKDGVNYVTGGAFSLDVFDDDYDPWAMMVTSFPNKIGEFTLLTPDEAMEFCHTDAPIDAVHVIESGDVRVTVETVFGYKSARAVVKYIMSESEGLKVDVRIEWNQKQKMVKMTIPTGFAETCIGEHAYGREVLKNGLKENVSQKYIAVCSDDKALLAANNGVYGSSFDENTGTLYVTLLRSAAYTAHPVDDRTVMPQDRYMPYMEQGERDFSFKLDIGDRETILEKAAGIALEFNMQPMVLSFYPTGVGELPKSPFALSDKRVNMTTFKRAEDGNGYIIRLFNPTENECEVTAYYENYDIRLKFGAFEIKTIRVNENGISETDLLENLLD